jgi:hypothetical protein
MIEQQFNALTRRQLALFMLGINARLAAPQSRVRAAFLKNFKEMHHRRPRAARYRTIRPKV